MFTLAWLLYKVQLSRKNVTPHEFAYILSITCLLTLDPKVHGIVCFIGMLVKNWTLKIRIFCTYISGYMSVKVKECTHSQTILAGFLDISNRAFYEKCLYIKSIFMKLELFARFMQRLTKYAVTEISPKVAYC